jgi:hypothetical protein
LSLYCEDLKQKRGRVKPGLTPFFVDMPKTFEEICASEEKYIDAYENNPFKTQWKVGAITKPFTMYELITTVNETIENG